MKSPYELKKKKHTSFGAFFISSSIETYKDIRHDQSQFITPPMAPKWLSSFVYVQGIFQPGSWGWRRLGWKRTALPWHCRALQSRAAFRAEKEEDVTRGTDTWPSQSFSHSPKPAASWGISSSQAKAVGLFVSPAQSLQTWAAAHQPAGGKENSSSSSQRVPSAQNEQGLTFLPNLPACEISTGLPAHPTCNSQYTSVTIQNDSKTSK